MNMLWHIKYKFTKHIDFIVYAWMSAMMKKYCDIKVLPTVQRLAPGCPSFFSFPELHIHIHTLQWLRILHKGKITCFPTSWFVCFFVNISVVSFILSTWFNRLYEKAEAWNPKSCMLKKTENPKCTTKIWDKKIIVSP